MILWDRNKNKITGASSEDRKELAEQMCTRSYLEKVNRGNTLINIAVPAGIFALFGFDLVVFWLFFGRPPFLPLLYFRLFASWQVCIK